MKALALAISLILLISFCSLSNSNDAGDGEIMCKVVVAIKQTDLSKFKLVIVNVSENPICFGDMVSSLGFDQFVFKVHQKGVVKTVARNEMFFTVDKLTPISIPRGSYHEFKIDFLDNTWGITKSDVESWERLMVEYQPLGCDMVEKRKQVGIFSEGLVSKWVSLTKSQNKGDAAH